MAIIEVQADQMGRVEEAEFMMEEHASAALKVCKRAKYIITCRQTGKDSIARLRDGNPAKGHDILSKSLKPKSLRDLVKDEDLRSKLNESRKDYFGLVARWEKKGEDTVPTGILTVAPKNTGKPVEGGHFVSFDQMDESVTPLGYTGDYDLHDILYGAAGAGRRLGAPVPSESPDQWDAIRKLNIEMFASQLIRKQLASPWGNLHGPGQKNWENPYSPIRHGPQRNYWAYALADVHEKDIIMSVVGYDNPIVAFHPNGKAYILEEVNDIKNFYRQNGGFSANIWDLDVPRAWEKYGRWLYYRWSKARQEEKAVFGSKLLAWEAVGRKKYLDKIVNAVMHQSSRKIGPGGQSSGEKWMEDQYDVLVRQVGRG